MIKPINIPAVVALLLSLSVGLKAQEQLMPLSANGQLVSLPAPAKTNLHSKTTTTVAVIDLPFFEDFSYSPTSPYPSPNYWLDSSVFINHTFPIAPPSIGVATFDGLNKKGYPYNLNALTTISSPADRLTSKPINLKRKGLANYQPGDSMYLSFYYQAEGYGDAPEPNDSLSLDFYKPQQNTWVKVWGRRGYNPGAADSSFRLVMVPIKDIDYFDSLFQFRFRNRATLSGSLDHWHIDYIYLNKLRSRTDTVIEDIAFEYMSKPFLKNYSTMPYRQFVPTEMALKFNNYMRNNYNASLVKNVTYTFTVFNQSQNPVYSYNGLSANMPSYSTSGPHTFAAHTNSTVVFSFTPAITDTLYTIKHVISTTTDFARANDTLIQKQKFSNYYAYDDGTAEVGYYNNTFGAKNAVRYTIFQADTLRALRIYFDPITNGQNIINSTFNIMVWRDGPNGPGALIYSDSTNNESRPAYLQGQHNLMPTYKLSSCLLLSPGTYYFGIKQRTNQPLNIGFDRNNDHSNALYYDIGNGWVQSTIKGSLMINPVLGCTVPTIVGLPSYSEKVTDITVFPNPAQNSIHIDTHGLVPENATVSILSSIGQTLYSIPFNPGEPIEVGSLPNGIYIVQLHGKDLSVTRKLIIAR